MSYASGGLIEATDYNGIVSSNVTANLSYVWGVGSGEWGYGQTTTQIATVSTAGLVTATQWAGLVFTLNRILGHQYAAGAQLASGSNIGITAGATITFFSNVASAVGNVAANHRNWGSQGSTVTGSNFTATQSYADSTTTKTFSTSRTVTFASGGDAARYFFNSGGRLQLVVTAVSNNGTGRSADYVTLFQTNLGGAIVGAQTDTARTGSGGTLISSNTNAGYYSLSTTPSTYANIASASATYTYTNQWLRLNVTTNNPQGSNSDRGSTVTFTLDTAQAAQTNSNFNDAVNVTVTTRVDIILPETTFLANTWGVIGVT